MKNFNIREAIGRGIIASVIALSVSAIGMVELFGERFLLANTLTMGQLLVFLPAVAFSYMSARSMKRDQVASGLLTGLIIGLVNGLAMLALIWAEGQFDIRSFFVNVSPKLIELLTFGLGRVTGSIVLFAGYLILGVLGAGMRFLPKLYSYVLLNSIAITIGVGLFSELLNERIRNIFGQQAASFIFQSKALQLLPAILIFVLSGAFLYQRYKRKEVQESRPAKKDEKTAFRGNFKKFGLGFLLLILPALLGTYLTEVTNNIGIFILMGLGLNIVVGLAGLLDLGYVAFFAIGAYTMAVLTTEGQLGIGQLSFWAALPISVIIASLAGILLGIPVLRMRGDYLAIVTLGFGEIIRILALSDMLKPYIGGAQGILKIPKPEIGGLTLLQPQQLYFVILAAVLFAAFISIRLRGSRLGRQWMAMREDEDVAEAMGINLVNTKLLAFGIGAAFSGLAGAIFASKLTSIFPHSFSLLISINVLSLIIIGGLGSIPGAIVGAAILVGLPELLREFQEFRFLMYGIMLIAMMILRPQGFIPSNIISRESTDDKNQLPEAKTP